MDTLAEPEGKLNIEQCADLAEKIRKLVSIAVAEEREACAKIAEQTQPTGFTSLATSDEIARRIRARGR